MQSRSKTVGKAFKHCVVTRANIESNYVWSVTNTWCTLYKTHRPRIRGEFEIK